MLDGTQYILVEYDETEHFEYWEIWSGTNSDQTKKNFRCDAYYATDLAKKAFDELKVLKGIKKEAILPQTDSNSIASSISTK